MEDLVINAGAIPPEKWDYLKELSGNIPVDRYLENEYGAVEITPWVRSIFRHFQFPNNDSYFRFYLTFMGE